MTLSDQIRPFAAVALLALAAASPAPAQSEDDMAMSDSVKQVSTHMGEMTMGASAQGVDVDDSLRFEPFQHLAEMFTRDDVVFVMRHGPTDWSSLDEKAVGSSDCENQRVMVEEGRTDMRNLGALLASNGVVPAKIVVSEWCRNQQTVESMLNGFELVDPAIAEEMPVETDPGLNLMLSLQGAPDAAALRERVSNWDGHPERSGPLLLVTHYTNIEEMTQFRVFEGEILVVDPKRDNLVLGYVRLKSAEPDVGHFADALNSPLLDEGEAVDMVSRYYTALNTQDEAMLDEILAERWVVHGASPNLPNRGVEGWLDELSQYTDALEDATFEVEEVHLADDIITVIGSVTGRHTGELFGQEPTGQEVAFGSIAVHRVADGQIVESWQMADRLGLMRQLQD